VPPKSASLAGWYDRAVTLARLALELVDPAVEPLRAGAVLERLARYHWLAGGSAEAMAAIERAAATIPAAPPSPELARTLAAQGQLLMLLSHHAEALGRCEQAAAMARQVGDRAIEGHALTTLGTSLSILGQVDAGIAKLAQGRAIARALGGRRERAERLLAEVFDLALRTPAHRVWPLIARGTLRLRRGDLEGARADFRRILDDAYAPLDPQSATPVYAGLAEAATWDDCLPDARAAVAEGLTVLAGSEEPYWIAELCRAGLAVEAAIAEHARARHAADDERAARELAAGLIERVRAAISAREVVTTPVVEANTRTAEAEWSRVTGPSDPERWAASARAWEAVGGFPWPAAYARWRQGEALLTVGAPRSAAAEVLATAWTLAQGLDAKLLAAEIDALARRARIELLSPTGEAAPDGLPAQAAATDDALGLTPREREVLALLAVGRTNRQIAETLFISGKTASLHVSNILAKLGVANRGEAAAVAHRLRLTG
jgi:DNA-binding CsgD family transcriptional regulator